MEHAGDPDVLDIRVLSREFRRQVDARHGSAHDFVLLGILGARFGSHFHIPAFTRGDDFQVEALATDEIAVGDFLGLVAGDAYDTIAHGKLFRRSLQPCCGQFQKLLARGRRGLAQLWSGSLERPAGHRHALVYRLGGVPPIHLDFLKRHIQLVGHNLGQSGFDAGTKFHLAGEDRDASVLGDCEPGIELCRLRFDGGQVWRLSQELGDGCRKTEADNQPARAFKKSSAGNLSSFHVAPPRPQPVG